MVGCDRTDKNNIKMLKYVAGYKDERTGKLYRNTAVQTLAETSADLSKYKDKISLAIQTCQTRNATTNVMGVDFGTQTETINVLRSLNCVGEIGKCRKM